MGRYYWGDIEGKFWFAVQPTSDLLEFGHDRNDTSLNVVVYFDDLQDNREKLRKLKKDFRKHGMTFEEFMTRMDNNGFEKTQMRTAEWQAMCREASLISLGEKIVKALKDKKDDLFISGEC
jgi:hypothetical protein